MALGVAASRSFSWGINASVVLLEGAIMPAAEQQRLFVSSVSTLGSLRSKAVVDWVSCRSIRMPLSSKVRLRVGSSAAAGA